MAYFTHTQSFSQNHQNTTQNLQTYSLTQHYEKSKIYQDYNNDLIQDDYNQYGIKENVKQLQEQEPFQCVSTQNIINNLDYQQYLIQNYIANDQRLFLKQICFHQVMSNRYTTLLHIQNIERIDDHHYNLYSKPFFEVSQHVKTIHIWEFVNQQTEMDRNYKIAQNQLIQYSDGTIHINFPSSHNFPTCTPLSALINKLEGIPNNSFEIKSTIMLIQAYESRNVSLLNQLVCTDLYVQLIQQKLMYLITTQKNPF